MTERPIPSQKASSTPYRQFLQQTFPLLSLVFNRLTPLVSRGAPGSCDWSLRSVDTGAPLLDTMGLSRRGRVSVRGTKGVLAAGGNAPGHTGEVTEVGPMVNYLEMVDYKLFSADSHVSEPLDLWVGAHRTGIRVPGAAGRVQDEGRQSAST